MLRGWEYNWRQAIVYYISYKAVNSTQLSKLILETLDFVNDIGLKFKSMVCDRCTLNRSAVNIFNITKDKPYIDSNVIFNLITMLLTYWNVFVIILEYIESPLMGILFLGEIHPENR